MKSQKLVPAKSFVGIPKSQNFVLANNSNNKGLCNSSYIFFVLSLHRTRRRKLLPLVYSIRWMLKAKTEACCQVRISSALAVDPEFILPSLLIINRLLKRTWWRPNCPWGCCISGGRERFCWVLLLVSGLEKSAAIRPFATKKFRLASSSDKILLVDSLATESCRLADRLSTKLFFKADNADADRTWSRKVFGRRLCRSKMQGSWPFGPVDRVCE